ncbi:MAG: hypothetical protein IPM82_10645 [Saprospiraceae bacterium]|nr:hypothetical protein [Saprospiraceae bacterium]
MSNLRTLGYLTWLVLFAMSFVFFKERAFFMDAGFQLFNLINEQKIQVYHYRFVTAVPQVVPFLMMKMGAPLWALAMGFSSAYLFLLRNLAPARPLFALRCPWLGTALADDVDDLRRVLPHPKRVQPRPVTADAGLRHCAPQCPVGCRLAVGGTLATGCHCGLFAQIEHHLHGVPLGFFWLKIKELRHLRYGLVLGIFMLATAIKSVFFTNWYEAAKQAEFAVNLQHYFPKFWAIPSNFVFLERCLHYYYLLPLLLGVVSVFYLRKKQWLLLGLVWSFSLGYLLLYNIADPQAKFRFYSEVSYLPLSIFVAVPLFFDVFATGFNVTPASLLSWPKAISASRTAHMAQRWPSAMTKLVAAVLLLRLATIAWNHRTVATQFSWIEQHLDRPGNRFLLQKNLVPMDTVLMEWGVPFTAMHLSALASPDSAETLLVLPDFEWFEDKIGREDVFFSPFHKVLERKDFNENYYRLQPGRYELVQ